MLGSRSFSASALSESPSGPIAVQGVAATGGVGSVSVNGEADVILTGLQATVSTSGVVFNESISVTGLAATSDVGSATSSGNAQVPVTGLAATMPMTSSEAGGSLLGGLTLSEEPFATLSDDSLQISVQLGVGASVTGLAATSAVGSVDVTGPANVSVTGIAATGTVGSVTVVGAGQVAVTGLAGTGGVGAVTVTEGTGVNVSVTSPRMRGSVGVVTAIGEISVLITGVEATGQVGQAGQSSWNTIDPNQNANWVEIAA